MLRSSIGGTKLCQENFGLHAALPHKAFDLLNRKFRVTFECFASPFNCYFSQYCSAFPDIDCYFGSRGSFFEFRPKSGSFQANPPFSEEVMLAMADHMISLLNGKFLHLLVEYGIFGEGSQICRYCLRRKGHKSQLLAGEGSQISLF